MPVYVRTCWKGREGKVTRLRVGGTTRETAYALPLFCGSSPDAAHDAHRHFRGRLMHAAFTFVSSFGDSGGTHRHVRVRIITFCSSIFPFRAFNDLSGPHRHAQNHLYCPLAYVLCRPRHDTCLPAFAGRPGRHFVSFCLCCSFLVHLSSCCWFWMNVGDSTHSVSLDGHCFLGRYAVYGWLCLGRLNCAGAPNVRSRDVMICAEL